MVQVTLQKQYQEFPEVGDSQNNFIFSPTYNYPRICKEGFWGMRLKPPVEAKEYSDSGYKEQIFPTC